MSDASERNGLPVVDLALVRTTMQTARVQLAAAETELDEALREIRDGARADKRHVSERIERAFSALRDARQVLAGLEPLLAVPGTP